MAFTPKDGPVRRTQAAVQDTAKIAHYMGVTRRALPPVTQEPLFYTRKARCFEEAITAFLDSKDVQLALRNNAAIRDAELARQAREAAALAPPKMKGKSYRRHASEPKGQVFKA